jgi:hypothetical protein
MSHEYIYLRSQTLDQSREEVSDQITPSSALPIPSENFLFSQNLMVRSAFRCSQVIPQTRINIQSRVLISHKLLTSQNSAQSQKPLSDKALRSNPFDSTAGITSSVQNPHTQSPLTRSEIIPQTRKNIDSDLLSSHKSPTSDRLSVVDPLAARVGQSAAMKTVWISLAATLAVAALLVAGIVRVVAHGRCASGATADKTESDAEEVPVDIQSSLTDLEAFLSEENALEAPERSARQWHE